MSNIEQRRAGLMSIFPPRRTPASEAAFFTMPGLASPATRMHDVVVINDQTGARWLAPVASISGGLIVVTGLPPRGFLDNPTNTFTVSAEDGGGRRRSFRYVTLERSASKPPTDFAFT